MILTFLSPDNPIYQIAPEVRSYVLSTCCAPFELSACSKYKNRILLQEVRVKIWNPGYPDLNPDFSRFQVKLFRTLTSAFLNPESALRNLITGFKS